MLTIGFNDYDASADRLFFDIGDGELINMEAIVSFERQKADAAPDDVTPFTLRIVNYGSELSKREYAQIATTFLTEFNKLYDTLPEQIRSSH